MKKYAESTRFGVYNRITHKWRRGIYGVSQEDAVNQLIEAVGRKDAYKWRYEIRPLPLGTKGCPYIPFGRRVQ